MGSASQQVRSVFHTNVDSLLIRTSVLTRTEFDLQMMSKVVISSVLATLEPSSDDVHWRVSSNSHWTFDDVSGISRMINVQAIHPFDTGALSLFKRSKWLTSYSG